MTRVLKISIFAIFLLFNQSIYAGQLKYPGDCNSKKIKKDGSVITLLPIR